MFEQFVTTYGLEILALLLCAMAGTLGLWLKKTVKPFLNDETKVTIARLTVQYVEQVWKTIHGPEKLSKALEVASVLLKKKGIDFDAEEMTIMIEAAVAEFNEAFRKPVESENADSTYRVPETVE